MTMNWSDERYVRLYTRDGADLLAVGWEGRLVFYELLRKVDRAGVLQTDADLDLIPELLRIPHDVFATGLERLKKRRTIEITDRTIVIPNFIAAQEAPLNDRARQRESRQRRADRARAQGEDPRLAARPDRFAFADASSGVTNRDPNGTGAVEACGQLGEAPVVTNCDPMGSPNVTPGHAADAERDVGSQMSRLGHSDPFRSVPSRTHIRAPARGTRSEDLDRSRTGYRNGTNGSGGIVPGSLPRASTTCIRCGKAGGAMVDCHGEGSVCNACYFTAPTEET